MVGGVAIATEVTITGDLAGLDFAEFVQDLARQGGHRTIRVILNGNEVEPETAPTQTSVGDHVEVRPYDRAGGESQA